MNLSKNTSYLHENNQSLKEALNIMKGLGSKKNEGSLTLHSIAKEIYEFTLRYSKKCEFLDFDLDEIDDMMETPEATRQIMLATKDNLKKILGNIPSNKIISNDNKSSLPQKAKELNLVNQLKERDNKIKSLQTLMMQSEKNFKNLQLKLLNSIKKMNVQLHEKQLQLNELKQIVAEKQEQLESLGKVNDKKYKRIRELEEDLYDLQVQLQNKNSQLVAEKNCSVILQKKLNKIIDQSVISAQEIEQNQVLSFHEFDLACQLAQNQQTTARNSEIGIQTDRIDNQEIKCSQQVESLLDESRESKYLESIERLTSELSEAYERINILTGKQGINNLTERKMLTGKTKTSSTYFSKKQ